MLKYKTVQVSGALALGLMTLSVSHAELPSGGQPKSVSHLIKCHEGKFDAMNAVSQLTREISADSVYAWSGIGAYPDGHTEGELVMIEAPFEVSAPTFIEVGKSIRACVSINKR